jgi:MoaA/NifB/PqqE/SkfB family radical SAM enzyme
MPYCETIAAPSAKAYQDNLRLSQLEYEQRQVYLYSRPRCLGLVLGNACNIDCVHCYQSKNGDNLFRPPTIARELRRELMAFYPYVSTLRIQGGEVFAIRGFSDLVEDVARLVDRPILSISTNGTLISEEWAERLVRTPFSNVTISIDGGTRATYNRLRRGADLDQVLDNIDRIQRWKAKLRSEMPYLDSFFVVMRSTFREIPEYLELMREHGMVDVALQTMELTAENTGRTPSLAADEALADRAEVEELYAILREALPIQAVLSHDSRQRLQSLFEAYGLAPGFLNEGEESLYPDSEGLSDGAFELCPNPWTTLFVVENGDVHLCFISEPIGNLYADSLAGLWNSPNAIAKRSNMIAGRYLTSGCSRQYCGWREGHPSTGTDDSEHRSEWRDLVQITPAPDSPDDLGENLALVRRLMPAERRRRGELESLKTYLESTLAAGRSEIQRLEEEVRSLENHIDQLEANAAKAPDVPCNSQEACHKDGEPMLQRMAHRIAAALRST